MINYLYNSAAFIRIFRSTALFALMGFFIAACNQEATSVKEEGTAAPSTYSAQSMAQARRDTQEEKNADRDLKRYEADLQLKATQIRAEQEAKNQFDTQASNLESERVRQQGENYRADKAASAQTMGSVTNALGGVIQSVGPAMVDANARKAMNKDRIEEQKADREDRKAEAEGRLGYDYYKTDVEAGLVGGEGGGQGKSPRQVKKEQLSLEMNDLNRMQLVKDAKKQIDIQAAAMKNARNPQAEGAAQTALTGIAAQYPELNDYAQAIINKDPQVETWSSEFDNSIGEQIDAQIKQVNQTASTLPPRDRPVVNAKTAVQNPATSQFMRNITQKSGVKAAPVVAKPPAKAPEALAQFMCDDADGCHPDDKAKLEAFNKGLIALADKTGKDFDDASKKLKEEMANYFTTIESNTSLPEATRMLADRSYSALNNVLNNLSNAELRNKLKSSDKTLAGTYKLAKENGLAMSVDASGKSVIDDVENIGLASADFTGSSWLTHPGSRDSSGGGSADDFYNIRPSTPTIGSSGGMGS